ncbi:unnamed protein product, partial [Arabidopsis halleri]
LSTTFSSSSFLSVSSQQSDKHKAFNLFSSSSFFFFFSLFSRFHRYSFIFFIFPLHSFLSIQRSVLSLLLREKFAVKSRNPP